MKYLIRCSSDPKIGLGHFMRCIRLYDELKKKGNYVKIYIDKKYKFMDKFNLNYSEIYPKKNFINQEIDSNLFIKKILEEYTKKEKKIIIKDDYRLKFLWEKKIKKKINSKMAVFDDFDNLNHFADIIINPKTKFFENKKPINKTTLGKKTIYLLGPKYSLIKRIKKNTKYKKFTVIINFGGSNKNSLFKKILSVLSKANKRINYILITSPFSNFKLKSFNKNNIKIVNNSFDLQNYYSKSHLFLGAAGTSIYEVSAQKIPGIFFKISNNQDTSSKSLEKMGQYFFLDKKYLSKKYLVKVFELIEIIKKNYQEVKNMTNRSLIKIDDKGALRISKHILSL